MLVNAPFLVNRKNRLEEMVLRDGEVLFELAAPKDPRKPQENLKKTLRKSQTALENPKKSLRKSQTALENPKKSLRKPQTAPENPLKKTPLKNTHLFARLLPSRWTATRCTAMHRPWAPVACAWERQPWPPVDALSRRKGKRCKKQFFFFFFFFKLFNQGFQRVPCCERRFLST